MKLLHIGAGKCRHEGLINLTEKEMDISKTWPYENESIDGVISMQVLQQLYWRDLRTALRETYRVLKTEGVMRAGTMLIENNAIDYMLGWKNVNMFSFDLLKRVLEQIGFREVRLCAYQETAIEEFKVVDNRPEGLGTSFVEARK